MHRSFRKLAPVIAPSPAVRSVADTLLFDQTSADQPDACHSEADDS